MKKVKLGEVATYINGYAFKPTNWTDVGLPIIRIQDLTGTSYQTNRFNGVVAEKYLISNGDVLISWSASLGVYVWKGEKAVLNQHIFKVVFDKVKVNKKFFIYQVESVLKKATGDVHGATMKHLTKPVFDALPFALPGLEEQKKIADRLDKVSSLIEKRKEQLAKLDQLIKSRFIEMFGDVDFPVITLDNICEFIRNGANIKQDKTAKGYPITRIETLSNDKFNLDRLGYANIFDISKYEKYILQVDDILISHINSTAYLGRAIRYKGESKTPIIHGMNLLCARIKHGFNATYVEHYFKCPYAKNFIRSITKQAVNQASISTSELKQMLVRIPPIELQNEFAEFVKLIDKSKFAVQKSIEKLETLKKSLMQQYFG